MGVQTLSLVVFVVEWTPLSFEVLNVEIKIWLTVRTLQRPLLLPWRLSFMRLYKMDKSYLNVFDCVRKRAKVSILALTDFSWIHVAKLSFVFVLVI